MSENSNFLAIKTWAVEDRPREKLTLKGVSSLSDAELIAILIGTGTASLSAVDVAKKVLASVDNDLNELSKLTINDLIKTKGIGEAKAITIISALELGRRRRVHTSNEKPKIASSQHVYDIIAGDLVDLPHEEFWVLMLNRANRVIRKVQISQGGVNGTVADPKIIFKAALESLASAIILAHNHPSGNLSPSQADIELTKKVKEAGKTLEITVLDHIIVAGQNYYSFADEGVMP